MLRTPIFIILTLCLGACSYLPFLGDKNGSKNGQQGGPATVSVTVEGVDDSVGDNIRVYVGISRNLCTTPVDLLKRRHEKTLTEARNALQAYGYYLPDIEISYEQQEACPLALIRVVPGERMQVSDVAVTIEGPAAEDAEFLEQIAELPMKAGSGLNHDDYSRSKSLIESVAAELGYLDGRYLDSTLTIDMQNYEASASLRYESGERYLLGTITVQQSPSFLDEALVNRLLEVPEDKQYATGKLMAMQNRLLTSDYFRTVDLKPVFNQAEDRQVPIDVVLSPSDKHKFSAAVGFATDEGVRARLGYTNRRFNTHGHQLGTEAKFSQSEYGGTAYYRIPREHPSNEWLRFSAAVRNQDYDSYETLSARFTISETKRRFWGILEDHYVMLARDDFDVGNESGLSFLLVPGVSWDKRIVDNEVDPRSGININLDIRGTSESLSSDTSYFRSRLHLHYLQAMPFDSRVILRSDLGWMWVDDFRVLPPSERFFAGGDNNLRGYDFQSQGPVNNEGYVIGGRYLAIVSLELEKYVTDKWGVAAFVDTGNAYGGPGRDTGLKTGVGIGLRWRSPVGPIRIDFAHPLDLDDTWLKLHLRIGPDI